MLFVLLLTALLAAVAATPLDDYVWQQDPAYGWTEIPGTRYEGKGFKGYCLNMTSQTWLTEADFAPGSHGYLWWHYLYIVVPDELDYTRNASLYITGGHNGDAAPDHHSMDVELAIALALMSRTVTAALFMVPNQAITFSSDATQKSRSEDAIIAFTWDHFLNDPSDPTWLVRFPMVKAGVRAMDAMREFMIAALPETNTELDYFVVTGASKRGWTTWLVGAVDPARVMAIVPIVLDAINFIQVEHHQFQSYNGWAYALSDYTDMKIMERLDDPNMLTLSQNEDPFYYASRLTMPKLIINAAMDEFQQPDDTHYWWSSMPEPKHFAFIPNAEHSMYTGLFEAVPVVGTWITELLAVKPIPTFTWTINNSTGEIVVTLDNNGDVEMATMHWAHSCGVNNDDGKNRRDFRISSLDNPCHCGFYADGTCVNLKSIDQSQVLTMSTEKGKRVFRATQPIPTDGTWTNFFISVKYRLKDLPPDFPTRVPIGLFSKDFIPRLEFTSEVSVVPNVFPYPPCQGSSCGERLL